MQPANPLLLASTSPYRRAQFERLGLQFDSCAPGVDEGAWKDRGLAPRDLAAALALAKAEAVARRFPRAVVVGGDQVVALGPTLLGKPVTPEAALRQLLLLAGRVHELWSAAAILGPGRRAVHVERAALSMRALPEAALSSYVAADQPLDCAGSYKLEARGIALFERIECADWTAIEGLPLLWVSGQLSLGSQGI
jgi:septum formation protein